MAETAQLLGRRILVVEDDFFLSEEVRSGLEKHGAVVVGPSASADEAERLLASNRSLHAAVLDVHLKDEDAYALADQLIARGVRIVLVTGYDRAAIPPRYADVTLLSKPVSMSDLIRALRA